MSLTVAAILLGFVVLTIPIFARGKLPQLDLSLLLLTSVLMFARGPEPAQTYILLATLALAVLLFALMLMKGPRGALAPIRTQLVLLASLTVAFVLAEFVMPETRAVQMPMLALIVLLAAAFIITSLTKGTVLIIRAWRQRPKSA